MKMGDINLTKLELDECIKNSKGFFIKDKTGNYEAESVNFAYEILRDSILKKRKLNFISVLGGIFLILIMISIFLMVSFLIIWSWKGIIGMLF